MRAILPNKSTKLRRSQGPRHRATTPTASGTTGTRSSWLAASTPRLSGKSKRGSDGSFAEDPEVHGAVSIVNAIATGNGATLGIDTFVKTRLEVKEGTGIYITSDNKTISSRLINKVIQNSVPKKQLEKTRLELDFQSNIPTGKK